jgi:uncharacterized protein YfiM (DUF2279 family)
VITVYRVELADKALADASEAYSGTKAESALSWKRIKKWKNTVDSGFLVYQIARLTVLNG